MKKLILSSFALVAFVLASNSAFAQDLTSNLEVTIPTVMEFTIAEAGEELSLSFADAAELIAGKTLLSAVSLNYKSNVPTFVSIKASAFTDGGELVMTSDKLGYNTDGGTTFAPFTVADTYYSLKGSLASKNDAAADNIVVSYKLTPGIAQAPAVYTNIITYTISAN